MNRPRRGAAIFSQVALAVNIGQRAVSKHVGWLQARLAARRRLAVVAAHRIANAVSVSI
jgi:DNA-binding CsgD family transcriptional regulator